jgi:phage gpG-like protein
MSRVDVKWFGREFNERLERAVDIGLGRAASDLHNFVLSTLSKTTGRADSKTPTGRNIYTASVPGTPPGSRSGLLRNRTTWAKVGHLRYGVGTDVPYARIHELGGTINHPGGTPYIVTTNGAVFLSKTKADQLRQRGFWVGLTKPHPIKMPRRPYLVPALEEAASSGRLQRVFSQGVRDAMEGAV